MIESVEKGKVEKSNGAKQMLLWVNTVITGLVFPVLIIVGIRLWDKLEVNRELMIRIDERQQSVLRTLPILDARLAAIEERLRKLEVVGDGKP